MQSVSMTEWGFQRLFDNLKTFHYQATNLLSCMTLDVENCHSTVHIKQANMSAKEYIIMTVTHNQVGEIKSLDRMFKVLMRL